MNMKDGYFDGNEFWFRCGRCGDSERHPDKAHCSVNVFTSQYFCLRCQTGGIMSPTEMSFYLSGVNLDFSRSLSPKPKLKTGDINLEKGAIIDRYSALERFHTTLSNNQKADAFKSFSSRSVEVGYHLRVQSSSKISLTIGKKALGMPPTLKGDYYRVVEGPFDCIDPQHDVCTFGFPSTHQIKMLWGIPLIICPDGDVWQDRRKLFTFMKPLIYNPNLIISYIEECPNGKDPDECLPGDRIKRSTKEVKELLKPKRTFFLPKIQPESILEALANERTEEEVWAQYSKEP